MNKFYELLSFEDDTDSKLDYEIAYKMSKKEFVKYMLKEEKLKREKKLLSEASNRY